MFEEVIEQVCGRLVLALARGLVSVQELVSARVWKA
jgi:hypothetical protein